MFILEHASCCFITYKYASLPIQAFVAVGRKDAAIELTGMYLQRVTQACAVDLRTP
jgi:hypothetical protein